MSFLFYFVFLEKLEVEMNHCDGWPSKGNPIKNEGCSEEGHQ
jgi:hypothetical protein